jgi:uncharacterized protein YgiM (DUF1202 family)
MYKLANIICTTLCALSLNQSFADDVGFIPDHEISLSSPLDSQEPLQAFSMPEHHFNDAAANESSSHNLESSAPSIHHAAAPVQSKKNNVKQAAVKPFTGKVKAKKVRLRTRSDVDSTIVRELAKGEYLSVVAEKGDFWVVESPNNIKAYVFRSYVLDNIIEGSKVNVRLKPSVDSPVLTHLNSGDHVTGKICSINNKWMEINMPSDVRFYVAKQFIENAGSPEVKMKYEARRQSAMELLDSAQHFSKTELAKNFPEIDFDKVSHNYHVLLNEYSDFVDLTASAADELAVLQEQYIDKRLSYAEYKNQNEAEKMNSSELASSSLLLNAITDKMKLWEPIEESLYLSWSNINESRTLDEYYAEQKISATEVSGILEPYTAPVKCKPGDFIVRMNDLPVAYVYSTQVNLQNLVGQKVTLKGAPRPNNNFAFPAFFVLSAE